jgi:hypothetical protein
MTFNDVAQMTSNDVTWFRKLGEQISLYLGVATNLKADFFTTFLRENFSYYFPPQT